MLENIQYSPTLYTRVAEIKAVRNLPAATKDRLFPVFRARPWPNAKELSRTWEKIDEAFGERLFALELDESRRLSESRLAAAEQFRNLFNPEGGYSNYYGIFDDVASAIPVVRLTGGLIPDLGEQAAHIERIDRGAVLRLEHGRVQNPNQLVDIVSEAVNDCLVVIDCGWGRDLLGQELWASNIIQHIIDEEPETELVVTGSSFPDTFVNQGARFNVSVLERSLFDNLVRRHNAARITYGDWGSTRPPGDPTPMRLVPRIDLPTTSRWTCFRRDNDYDPTETYEEIAQRTVADTEWPNGLNIWGTYTILNTANGLPGGIASPATATSARVNIHVHRQAYFGANYEASDDDEPFED